MVNGMLRMAIFIFCGQFLIFFRPEERYEKYFRLLVNLMIMLLFIVPFVSTLAKNPIDEGGAWIEDFLEEMDRKLDEMELEYPVVLEGSDEAAKREGDSYAQEGIRIVIGPIEIEEVEVGKGEKE